MPDCPDPWDKRLGVWGVFFEVPQASPTQPLGQPFPILAPQSLEQAVQNVSTELRFMPRVAYNSEAHSFYVAWREIPYMSPGNAGEEVRTHIRGAWIDYLVKDGVDAFNAPLNDNLVVSALSTSTCPAPITVGVIPNTCPSIEDPRFPDIAATDGHGAVVVWQQKLDFAADANTQIAGRALVPLAPANNAPADASNLEKTSLELKGTLLGASIDGVTNCGQADESPDVWYAYTATSPGVLHLNTCGSHDQFGTDTGMDTVLSLHRPDGSQYDGACNDDSPDGNDETICDASDLSITRDSAIQINMHQGQTVLARISRYGGSTGAKFLLNNSFEELLDSDSDGYADIADNCTQIANFNQRYTDNDGYGNVCDADFNGNLIVDPIDFSLLKSVLGSTSSPDQDLNGNGIVDPLDFSVLKSKLGHPSGPSGLVQ